MAVWEPRRGLLIRAFQIVPRAKDAGSFSGVARVVPSPEGSRLAVLTYSKGVLPALPASSACRSLDSMRQDAAGEEVFRPRFPQPLALALGPRPS